jgi:hypothetical protein
MADEAHGNELGEEPLQTGAEADVDMAEGEDNTAEVDTGVLTAPEEKEDGLVARVSFSTHLMSPLVTLIIGEILLTAHQSLLMQSPYFREACEEFNDDGSVSPSHPTSQSTRPPSPRRKRSAASVIRVAR